MMVLCVTCSGLTLKVTLSLHTHISVYRCAPCACGYCDYLCLTASDIDDWGVSPRGAGFLFGRDVVAQVRVPLLNPTQSKCTQLEHYCCQQ